MTDQTNTFPDHSMIAADLETKPSILFSENAKKLYWGLVRAAVVLDCVFVAGEWYCWLLEQLSLPGSTPII